jgi:hypothetical protein
MICLWSCRLMSLPRKSVPPGPWMGSLWQKLPDGFRYASNTNPQWLTLDQIRTMIAPIEAAYLQGTLE